MSILPAFPLLNTHTHRHTPLLSVITEPQTDPHAATFTSTATSVSHAECETFHHFRIKMSSSVMMGNKILKMYLLFRQKKRKITFLYEQIIRIDGFGAQIPDYSLEDISEGEQKNRFIHKISFKVVSTFS